MSKRIDRLFQQFRPAHYDVHITPDKESMTFQTHVVVRGKKVGRPSRRITLHAKGLKVVDVKLTKISKESSSKVEIERTNIHSRFDELRIHSESLIYPGDYQVEITTKGEITKPMQGLYPCYFKHEDKEKFLLATQLESHHAREVFPCIDEPEAKATFQLTITAPQHETVLSNTPIESEQKTKTTKTVLFEKTPRMSSYLLAFVMGEMHSVEGKTKSGTIVKSWASLAQEQKTLHYSVDEAIKILEYYEDYFGIPYPLEKCDQVALPDFDAGAMENWGLITYREIVLLTDPDNRSITSEQYVSMVVAHELSHQWFGNLVTMKWWDDLWLNESFASLMEHMALDAVHPEWHQWEQYVATDVISTSSRDVYKDIQPVGVTVTDPELIETLFDPGIVYAKGGRLLKMLKDYIGDEVFRRGLQAYFKKHAYQNTTREDLWKALSEASGKDVSSLMTPWLDKPGMPVVGVTQDKSTLSASQQRFLLDGTDTQSTWPIPLLTDKKEQLLLTNKKADLEIKSEDYAVLNVQASGHFFVHYQDDSHRQWLQEQLASQSIDTIARINTLNDMYMLSRGGVTTLNEGLNTIISCSAEPRDSVWSMISRIIGAVSQLTDGDKEAEEKLRAVKRKLGSYWYEKLGWKDAATDDANTRQLRHTAIAFMIGGEDKNALDTALKMYKANKKSLIKLPAEYRNTILGAAVRHGDKSVVDNLLSAYPDASPDLQLDIALALASTRDSHLAQTILDSALGDDGFVRAQDLARWIAYFMRNYYIRETTWNYIKKNWDYVQRSLEQSKSFDYIPLYCASPLSTKDWLKEYESFFKKLAHLKLLQKNISVGLSDIEARIAWRDREESAIKQWLKSNA